METVNLTAEFGRIADLWSPTIVGELNGQSVRLARVRGEFVWHRHDEEDELFLVVKGSLVIQLRDRDIRLGEGEMFIVPRGVEHKPVATQEAHILLFEPLTTRRTGDPPRTTATV